MQKISEHIIADNGSKKVIETVYTNDSGKSITVLTLDNSGSSKENVAVLIITLSGKIILNKEFRFGPRRYIVGVPTGKIDIGESRESAVIRETHEETGYKVKKMLSLGTFMDNTYTGGINHYFLALCDDVALDPTREAFEDIENILVTPEECEAMIFDGTIECCFTPAIYFLAKIKTKNFTDFSS